MWSSQSQPDMALVGVKSVLSPRPFSAPHNMESYTILNRKSASTRQNAIDDSESGSCQSSDLAFDLESEEADSYIDDVESLLSNQMEDYSRASLDETKSGTDCGVFDCGRDSKNNFVDNTYGKDGGSLDTDSGDCLPPVIHRLPNFSSEDSAFGSSMEPRQLSVEGQAKNIVAEEALENVQNTNTNESERDHNQNGHSSVNGTDLNSDNASNLSQPNSDIEAINGAVGITNFPTEKCRNDDCNELPTQPNYHRPLIPPSITFDMTTDDGEVPVKPAKSLQEIVDTKLLESQKTGHLDLANIGLPFIPSAILLSDSSMIHRVSLQDNGLVELPGAALEHLSFVTWLDLRYNELRALPAEVSELANLQVLLLQGNRLTALPVELGTLSEITTLQVSDNPLSFPPQDVIQGGTRAILSFLKSKCQIGEKSTSRSSSLANRRASFPPGSEKEKREEGGGGGEERGQTREEENPQGNHMRGTSSCASSLRRNFGQRSQPSENVDEIKGDWEDVPKDCDGRKEEEDEKEVNGDDDDDDDDGEEEGEEEEEEEWDSDDEEETEIPGMEESIEEKVNRESHQGLRKGQNRSPSTSATSGGRRYLSASPNSLQIAIRDGREMSDLQLRLSREALDSGRETLGRPPSPNSPCLLTPNIEFPRRPQYDLTSEQNVENECPFQDDNCPPWTCDCFKNSSPISKEKMKVISQLPEESRQRILKNMVPNQRHFDLHQCMMYNDPQGRDSAAHRRSLHLRLQKDNIEIEDDLESLEGDIGEGYRRPHSEPVGDKEKECHRQMSTETVLALPVVSLQLPSPHDLRPGCPGKRCRRSDRRAGDVHRKNKQGIASRMNNRDVQKSKLVTVSEVHRRAREERKRQREMLAATREMTAMQRLKSHDELEAWRDEAREIQLRQQQHYTLHPDLFLPAVCEAPFAVDGTTLTPRARAKMKPREQKRSLSPSVSDVSGVCAGVRKCLDELSHSSKGINSKHEGGGGSFSHTNSLVHQLSHLQRQLNRLRVNYVI